MAFITSSAIGIASSYSKIQSIACSGPAMNPSTDIDTCQTTFPCSVSLMRVETAAAAETHRRAPGQAALA